MNSIKELIQHWRAKLEGDSALASELNCRVKIVALGDNGGTYIFDCRNPAKGIVIDEGEGPADITVQSSADDLVAIANRKLNPQVAFMQGKLSVSGDMMLALKVSKLFAGRA